jgi:hypothetical protein
MSIILHTRTRVKGFLKNFSTFFIRIFLAKTALLFSKIKCAKNALKKNFSFTRAIPRVRMRNSRASKHARTLPAQSYARDIARARVKKKAENLRSFFAF